MKKIIAIGILMALGAHYGYSMVPRDTPKANSVVPSLTEVIITSMFEKTKKDPFVFTVLKNKVLDKYSAIDGLKGLLEDLDYCNVDLEERGLGAYHGLIFYQELFKRTRDDILKNPSIWISKVTQLPKEVYERKDILKTLLSKLDDYFWKRMEYSTDSWDTIAGNIEVFYKNIQPLVPFFQKCEENDPRTFFCSLPGEVVIMLYRIIRYNTKDECIDELSYYYLKSCLRKEQIEKTERFLKHNRELANVFRSKANKDEVIQRRAISNAMKNNYSLLNLLVEYEISFLANSYRCDNGHIFNHEHETVFERVLQKTSEEEKRELPNIYLRCLAGSFCSLLWKDIIEKLIPYGLDINARIDDAYCGLLMAAIQQFNVPLIQYLVEKGADPFLKSGLGNTAINVLKKHIFVTPTTIATILFEECCKRLAISVDADKLEYTIELIQYCHIPSAQKYIEDCHLAEEHKRQIQDGIERRLSDLQRQLKALLAESSLKLSNIYELLLQGVELKPEDKDRLIKATREQHYERFYEFLIQQGTDGCIIQDYRPTVNMQGETPSTHQTIKESPRAGSSDTSRELSVENTSVGNQDTPRVEKTDKKSKSTPYFGTSFLAKIKGCIKYVCSAPRKVKIAGLAAAVGFGGYLLWKYKTSAGYSTNGC